VLLPGDLEVRRATVRPIGHHFYASTTPIDRRTGWIRGGKLGVAIGNNALTRVGAEDRDQDLPRNYAFDIGNHHSRKDSRRSLAAWILKACLVGGARRPDREGSRKRIVRPVNPTRWSPISMTEAASRDRSPDPWIGPAFHTEPAHAEAVRQRTAQTASISAPTCFAPPSAKLVLIANERFLNCRHPQTGPA